MHLRVLAAFLRANAAGVFAGIDQRFQQAGIRCGLLDQDVADRLADFGAGEIRCNTRTQWIEFVRGLAKAGVSASPTAIRALGKGCRCTGDAIGVGAPWIRVSRKNFLKVVHSWW